MKRPFIQLVLVQLREFYREPAILFWALLFPILMAWGLGVAFNKKPAMTKSIALIEKSASATNEISQFFAKNNIAKSTDLKEGLHYYEINSGSENEGITQFKLLETQWDNAVKLLKKGSVTIIIILNGDKTEYHYDKFNSEAQLSYLQLTQALKDKPQTATQSEIKPMTQKGTRYIDFLIPGLLAMNLMMSTMWGISYTLIEARSKHMLRRMVVTPMPKWEYIASHFVARLLLSSAEALIIFTFAKYYFDMEISGNTLAFMAMFVSGLIAFTGLAVLIASRTSKTQIGNGLINFVIMPMMICSGIFFSYHNFPDKVIPLIQSLPLTMIADGIRSVFNEGAGFEEIWKQLVILNVFGLSCFTVGLKYYKWY